MSKHIHVYVDSKTKDAGNLQQALSKADHSLSAAVQDLNNLAKTYKENGLPQFAARVIEYKEKIDGLRRLIPAGAN